MKLLKTKKLIISAVFILSIFVNGFSQNIRDKSEVNGFDRCFMYPYSKTLDYLGTGFEVLSLLTPAVMLTAPSQDYWKIGIEYTETIAIAFGTKELAKYCVSRARPYMYFDDAPENKIEEGDWDNSFFSGHTTLSFAAAGFTTFMYCQYFPKSSLKFPVIATSYTLATATLILRVASGNHFMTDVLCGALVGSAIGYIVPWVNTLWWKPSESHKYQFAVGPAGLSLNLKI